MGAWAAVILVENEKKILTGIAENTTHQRMEITAVIEALNYVQKYFPEAKITHIISSSCNQMRVSSLGDTAPNL